VPPLSPLPGEARKKRGSPGGREEDRAALERGGNEREREREIKSPLLLFPSFSPEREREK
jgi:hypothetical protein